MNNHSQGPISPVEIQLEGIGDADSQGGREEEGREPMVKKMEQRPSQEEVDQHMLTHIPYRSWCDHCGRGRAVNDHHKKSSGQESSIPVISIDYAYFGETSEERQERKAKEKNGESPRREESVGICGQRERSQQCCGQETGQSIVQHRIQTGHHQIRSRAIENGA